MAADLTKIYSGPASLLIDDTDLGYTQGGIEATIAPKNRQRTVDIFGDSPVALVHLGDEFKVMAPMAELTAAVLQQIYQPGNDQTAAVSNKYMGIGRKAGYLYADVDVKIVPTISAQSAFKLHLYKASPVGQITQTFKASDDRIFKLEYIGLVDEAGTDGALIGTVMLAGTVQ